MLRAVLEHGSITAAALALHRSQQAVSARMRTLEAAVGVPLLVRGPGGATPSEAGALLATWIEEVLDAADRLEAGVATLAGRAAEPLRIGASQTIAETLLPTWLVRLRAAEEAVGLTPSPTELRVGNSTEVAARVRGREIELGFVETPHVPADLATVPIGTDELITVVAPGHPWARRRSPLRLDELAATPLVMREAGSGTRDALAEILAAQSPSLVARPRVELGTSAAVRSAIAAGIAPGVLSRLAVRDDLVLGRVVSVVVDAAPFLRPLTGIHLRGGRLGDAARRLLAIARERATAP